MTACENRAVAFSARRIPCRFLAAGIANKSAAAADQSLGPLALGPPLGPPLGPLVLVDLTFCLFLGDAITFLDFADQFVPVAFNGQEVVVGQLCPACLGAALELIPLTFYFVPVHRFHLMSLHRRRQRALAGGIARTRLVSVDGFRAAG